MRILFVLLFVQVSVVLMAQERCATTSYLELTQQTFPSKQKSSTLTYKEGFDDLVIQIPVVVHVLYNAASQNISEAQIRSGIDALNRDFRRRNADTSNTPEPFKLLAADVQIEFALATRTPSGNATPGIVRKSSSRNLWMADDRMKHTSLGGDDAWDSKSYLNIWIVNLVGATGYSSVPGAAGDVDGVVINAAAFGTINTSAPNNMGRAAVHEVGHWLGLKHIWGDKQCGDDGISDTPQQGFYTTGCPSGTRSSCDNGEAGDMYMNYMDYTNDACMNLFTLGQKAVMRSLFADGGARASLLESRGLNAPSRDEAALPVASASNAVYPNPAHDVLTVRVSNSMVGKQLSLYSGQGQLQKVEKITTTSQTIDVTNLKAGVYFLKGEGFQQKFIKL